MIMPTCQRAWIQPPPIPTLLALSPASPGPRRQGNQWQKDAAASEGRLAAHRRGSDHPDSEPSNCPWCTEGTKQHWHLASDTDWPGPRADSAARGRWTLLVTQPTQRRPRLGSASEAAKKKPQSITALSSSSGVAGLRRVDQTNAAPAPRRCRSRYDSRRGRGTDSATERAVGLGVFNRDAGAPAPLKLESYPSLSPRHSRRRSTRKGTVTRGGVRSDSERVPAAAAARVPVRLPLRCARGLRFQVSATR